MGDPLNFSPENFLRLSEPERRTQVRAAMGDVSRACPTKTPLTSQQCRKKCAEAALLLAEMTTPIQSAVFRDLPLTTAKTLFQKMSPSLSDEEIAALFSEIPPQMATGLLHLTSSMTQRDVLNLLWQSFHDQDRALLHSWEASIAPKKSHFLAPLDETEFPSKVLESSHPVFVYIENEYCKPCWRLRPIVDDIAAHEEAGFHFYEMDSDRLTPEFLTRWELAGSGVPLLLRFDGGKISRVLRGYNLDPAEGFRFYRDTPRSKERNKKRILEFISL